MGNQHTNLKATDIVIGAKVAFNGGFEGLIVEIYVPIVQHANGMLSGMVVVRTANGRGTTCIDVNDCEAL